MTVTTAPGAIAPPAYTVTARVLHWVTAALVLIMIPVGIIIANEWGGTWQERLYDLHKSTGLLIFPLVIVRLIYRWTHPPAPLPADIPALQQFVAHATHFALYAMLLIQPLLGWIATSAYPAPLPFFGLFNFPPIWPSDNALSEKLFQVHRLMGIGIGLVAAMHVGGALYHHFVRRDRVLMRMISG
jgi:cytochrome b561